MHGLISRKRFLARGTLAAILVPFLFTARQNKTYAAPLKGATSARITDFPYNCVGDGTDETDKIQRCFNDNLYVEIPEPPAGVGYGVSSRGLSVKSGTEIDGVGSAGKLLRIGDWQRLQRMIHNKDRVNGNSGIRLNNLFIDGRRKGDITVPTLDSDMDASAISFHTNIAQNQSSDIRFSNISVRDWPGVGIRMLNVRDVQYTDVEVYNPGRGGVIFSRNSSGISLVRVKSTYSGDDAFAFYALEDPRSSNRGPINEIYVSECTGHVRPKPEYGAALKFWGARDASVRNSTFSNSRNSNVLVASVQEFLPSQIDISGCELRGGAKHSFHVLSNSAQSVSIKNSLMHSPAAYCVNVDSWQKTKRALDIRVTDNVMVNPGFGKYMNVHEHISGVHSSGNQLGNTNVKPRISSVSPKSGSRVRSTKVKVQAKISDTDSRIVKENVKLFVRGKIVPAGSIVYSRSTGQVTFSPRRLPVGECTVKVIVLDPKSRINVVEKWKFEVVS